MSQYLLQTGNTPSLTLAEAQAIIGNSVETIDEIAVLFSAESDQQASQLFSILGAAVKLIKVERSWQKYSESELSSALLELLAGSQQPKLQFSIAQWGDLQTERISLGALKEQLTDRSVKARFIEGARDGLSAAVLLHQEVTELIVFKKGAEILLGRTLAVQDIDHWTDKDRRKPYADRKKGMLPPKIARAMVNLALGPNPAQDAMVYDPFCGTGTVLIEALERGTRAAGSDADPDAAVGAQMNLAWFADRFHAAPDFTVFQKDVSHAQLSDLPGKADAIVTEPFLGKQKPQEAQLSNMFRGLEKLYLGAFHQWEKLLKPGGTIVMIFPRVELPGGQVFDCSPFVDKLLPRGYTLQVDFGVIRYHRPQALVQRDIVVFTYQPAAK